MIKAVMTSEGTKNVILGLSDENWKRLREGKPIMVFLPDLHPELPRMNVILLGGETEESLAEDLRALGPVRREL